MSKKFSIVGLAIFISVFSTSCSTKISKEIKNNVVVSASNITIEEEMIKEEPDLIELEDEKEAFLTFDDGPTMGITPEILDVLKENQVKATFFVIGKMAESNKGILLREESEGHAIANHSYTHDYKYLYSNPNNFVEDIKKADEELKNMLHDYDSKLIRFPGGSFGKEREAYRQAVIASGYHYVDWNSLNGDAEGKGNFEPDKLFQRVIDTSKGKNHLVVLMHDAPLKYTTVQALPKIIEYLKSQGYSFKTLE